MTVTGVGVLDKSMAIVDAVEWEPMAAADLAKKLGMNLSTTHRLAMALVEHGLLRRDDAGRFSHGPRFDSRGLAGVGQPIIAELSRTTGESATIWVRRGDFRLCILSVDSERELKASLPVGTWLPLGKGSASHVLLGDLEHGGPRGWYEVMGERTKEQGSVSAPVYHGDEIVAAVCVAAPISRLRPSAGLLYGQDVEAAARAIEHDIGWA